MPRARRGPRPGRRRRAARPGSMLSSSTRSTPAARASSSSSSVSTSTSTWQPAGEFWSARRAASADAAGDPNVVLLDEYRVVEAAAVRGPAAGHDRRLLERAQAGGRLARVEDPRAGPGDGLDVARGQGRDAGQAPEEVERDPLAGEDRPPAEPVTVEQLVAGLDARRRQRAGGRPRARDRPSRTPLPPRRDRRRRQAPWRPPRRGRGHLRERRPGW